jgi:hypothetical protein
MKTAQCDDCMTADKTMCAECSLRRMAVAARADRRYDEIREAGYGSEYIMQLNDEAEARAERLGYQ